MANEQNSKNKMMGNPGAGGAVYGMGLIGAIIYYFQNADSLTQVLLGIFKAVLWPAFLVYKTLEFLRL